MTILFLDDDDDRHEEFAGEARRRFDSVVHVRTYAEAVRHLDRTAFELVMLDHDLNFNQYQSVGRGGRELTGLDVARHMVRLRARPEVLVHSRNEEGAKKIERLLRSSGFVVRREPFGGAYAALV